jgi:hypothetical protein
VDFLYLDDDEVLGDGEGWAGWPAGVFKMDTLEVVVPTNRSLMSRRDPRGRYKTSKQILGESNRRTAVPNP